MRIHTDKLTSVDIYNAAAKAGANAEVSLHKSRSRARAYEVKLTGLSNRRPMGGPGEGDDYAATWDQWGVFLGFLYSIEYNMAAGNAYGDVYEFDQRTRYRFALDYSQPIPFPLDHDHRFRFAGVPFENTCTKCGAVRRTR